MSDRPTPTPEQVAHVFRELAEQRSSELARASLEDDWRRVQGKWEDQVRCRTTSPWWMLQSAISRWMAWPWATLRSGAILRTGTARWAFPALSVAASVVLAVWLLPKFEWPGSATPDSETLSYSVHSLPTTGSVDGKLANHDAKIDGDWIRTQSNAAALDFSDGSEVQLAAHSVLNVDVIGKHSARTRLESGRLKANVHHADETNWVFVAGPYEVRVVGTSFDLAWENSELSLVMHEGRVRVLGPDQAQWSLGRGQTLRVAKDGTENAARDDSKLAESASAAHAGTPGENVPPANESETDVSGSGPKRVENPATRNVTRSVRDAPKKAAGAEPADNWQTMLGKGRFDEIVNQANSRGLDSVLSGNSAAELAALAQAAGYSGKTALAARTWKAIRANHSGSSSARRGAFFLARLEERRGNNTDAIRWLDTYLREAPGGALAVEARGRKLVLVRRIHGPSSARAQAVAREYLERHPEGSYAETARATLGSR